MLAAGGGRAAGAGCASTLSEWCSALWTDITRNWNLPPRVPGSFGEQRAAETPPTFSRLTGRLAAIERGVKWASNATQTDRSRGLQGLTAPVAAGRQQAQRATATMHRPSVHHTADGGISRHCMDSVHTAMKARSQGNQCNCRGACAPGGDAATGSLADGIEACGHRSLTRLPLLPSLDFCYCTTRASKRYCIQSRHTGERAWRRWRRRNAQRARRRRPCCGGGPSLAQGFPRRTCVSVGLPSIAPAPLREGFKTVLF